MKPLLPDWMKPATLSNAFFLDGYLVAESVTRQEAETLKKIIKRPIVWNGYPVD